MRLFFVSRLTLPSRDRLDAEPIGLRLGRLSEESSAWQPTTQPTSAFAAARVGATLTNQLTCVKLAKQMLGSLTMTEMAGVRTLH